MSRTKATTHDSGLEREKVFSLRFIVSLLLMAAGIAWIAFQYTVVRVDPSDLDGKPGGPAWMSDIGLWSYTIGFALLFIGLAVSAHPSTPLGRGRGVVVGMLSCFLLGMVWICVFYIFQGTSLDKIWVMNDLGNYNILVGIGFMAVGFSFATKWE